MNHCPPSSTVRRPHGGSLAAAVLAALLMSGAPDAAAQPAEASFEIPSQALDQALPLWARQAGMQLLAPPALLAGVQGRAVHGRLPLGTALSRLLQGTGLAGRIEGSTVIVERPAASSSTLPAVTVVGQAEEPADGPVPGYAARRTATGTKTDTPLIEVPQSISVIGREELDARGAQDVMEAVRYTPGVVTSVYGPDNRGWEDISLRGFPAYLSTYQNGLLQMPFGVTNYLSEPYMFERVEVLRGPSSVLYGQGDAGGIINRITKLASGERKREIELQYGSHQRKQLAFDLGDRFYANSDWSYRLVGVGLDSNDQDRYPDGHRLNRTRTVLAPSLRWQPNARTSLTLYGEYIRNSAAEDPYYINDLDRHITALKMGDHSFSGMKQSQKSVGYRLETAFADGWTLRQNVRSSKVGIDRRVVWNDGYDEEDGRTIYRTARTWDESLTQTAMDTSVEGRIETGRVQHTLVAGVDLNHHQGDSRQFADAAPTLDLYLPIYGQYIPSPTTPLNIYRQSTRQIGYYLQDQIKVDERWVLTLGGRNDHVRQTTNDPLHEAFTVRRSSKFSGRAGLTYLFGNGVAPYVSYAESFLPTPGLDGNGDPFKPTRGKQVEVGVKYQPPGSRLLVTGALFDLRKTHVVSYDPVTFEGRQIGKVRSRGLELEAKGELLPGLNLSASFTRMNTRAADSADPDEVGRRIPLMPRQTAAVWLDYTFGNGLAIGGGIRHQGNTAGDEHNTFFTPGFTVADLSVRYEQGPWRLALNVSNLFDRKYTSGCYVDSCYAGQRRTATLTARYRF